LPNLVKSFVISLVICVRAIFVLVIDVQCLLLWYSSEIWWFLRRTPTTSGIRA